MPKKNNKFIYPILILLISQVGLIYLWFSQENTKILNNQTFQKRENAISENYAINHSSYHQSLELYQEAYQQATPQTQIKEKVYGGIIPHHLMPKEKIATWFQGLENQKIKTVVLIGPNHYDSGKGDIIISGNSWGTPYGKLSAATNLASVFAENKIITVDPTPFDQEHSISGLVPFIKKSFPEANILPIILKVDTDTKNLDILTTMLESNLEASSTLVIASVDFSHYQPAIVADFHDKLSQGVIENFDLNRIDKLEVDSPPSLYTLLSYLDKIGSYQSQLVFHSNSSYLLNQPHLPGTSHFGYYFMSGEKNSKQTANLLFFGDLMLDRYIKNNLENNGLDYFLQNIAGGENRFFIGNDLVSANLEGAVTNGGTHYEPELINDFAIEPKYITELKNKYFFNFFNLANNHISDQNNQGIEETWQNLSKQNIKYSGCMDGVVDKCSYTNFQSGNIKIGLAGFSMVYHDFDIDQAKNIIKNLKAENDVVITQIHWGEEYEHKFNNKQQNIAHAIIEAGSDAIIGHHPHVVQGMEIYQNKPIFYSLGNFIFDQYFSEDTQQQLSIGLSFDLNNHATDIYFFPINSVNDQLFFMDEKTKNDFITNFINWSVLSEEYKSDLIDTHLQIK